MGKSCTIASTVSGIGCLCVSLRVEFFKVHDNELSYCGRDDFPSMENGKNGEAIYVGKTFANSLRRKPGFSNLIWQGIFQGDDDFYG